MAKPKTRPNWKLAAERAKKQVVELRDRNREQFIQLGNKDRRIAELERERDEVVRKCQQLNSRDYVRECVLIRYRERAQLAERAESFPLYRAWQWLKRKVGAEVERG